MAQVEQDNDLVNVWPKSLLLNQAYAFGFACVRCQGIPMCCMNNADGELLCGQCTKDVDNAIPTKVVQNMINKLRTRCLSLGKDDQNQNDSSCDEGNVVSTQPNDASCDWTGMIQNWREHSTQCGYMRIICDACKEYECQRRLMADHTKQCGAVTIPCPLSCGESILRKNKENHLENDCSEQLVICTNDDCKEQVKRKRLKQHVSGECDSRFVECEYTKYGCSSKQIKASHLKHHMDGNKFDHLQQQFIFVTNQLNEKVSNLQQQVDQQKRVIDEHKKEMDQYHALNDKVSRLQQQVNQQKKVIDELKDKEQDLWENGMVMDYDARQLIYNGWKCVYDKPYGHKTTTDELKSLCENDKKVAIFVGATDESDKNKIVLGAFGPSSVLHKMTNSKTEAYIPSDVRNKNAYGVYWYHYARKSFGFASVPQIDLRSADAASTNQDGRLSWHLQGDGGYRIGNNANPSDKCCKVIYIKK